MSQTTAKRRRKQMANGNKHLAKLGRSIYAPAKVVAKNEKGAR
jgi:hypothetical protein